MAQLTHEGALLKALQTLLNGDEQLRTLGNGAVFKRADPDTLTPFLTYYTLPPFRERTFGGEACRVQPFVVKATWDDGAGTNFLHGDQLIARANFLLDGGQAMPQGAPSAAARVQAFLNTALSLDGYYAMGCALQTDLPTAEELIGDAATGRHNKGSLFHLTMRLAT